MMICLILSIIICSRQPIYPSITDVCCYSVVNLAYLSDVYCSFMTLPPWQMLCDYGMEQGSMSPEVSDLLEHIWQEAIGELDQTLRVPLQDIKADQVSTTEAHILNLTRFNKIATQGAPQMAVDKEANSLSRVYSYDSKFNLRLFYV